MIPVVPDVDLVAHVPLQNLVPLLLRDKGGGVHGAPVADHEAVALAGLGESEERVLNLDHRAQKVFLHIQPQTEVTEDQYCDKVGLGRSNIGSIANLELDLSVLGQVGEVDASAQEDRGSLRDSVDLPAQVLEEGGEARLAGGLASAGASSQHQLPYLPLLLLRLRKISDQKL